MYALDTVAQGFSHFDGSHRENFCASLLLVLMEVEPQARAVVEKAVREVVREPAALGALLDFGREARLEPGTEGQVARTDIWLLFAASESKRHVFLEVKTHTRWRPDHVRAQLVMQRESPGTVRRPYPTHDALLLAPGTLCRAVNDRSLAWARLIQALRADVPSTAFTERAMQHLDAHADRTIGLSPNGVADLVRATSTVACLREFLQACVADLGGKCRERDLWLTPGNGAPGRGAGWAWHGLSVPFTRAGASFLLAIYRYVEAPVGGEEFLNGNWIEVYAVGRDEPEAIVPFDPTDLSPQALESFRGKLRTAWSTTIQDK